MAYWFGPPKSLNRGGAMVRALDDFRMNVCFLGHSQDNRFTAKATAFFVHVSSEFREEGCYLVTAGHVADYAPFDIRLNKRDGTSSVEQPDLQWQYHNDYPNVDLAIAHYVPPDWAQVQFAYPDDFAALDHHFRGPLPGDFADQPFWNIGAGDEVQIVGLFNLLPGKKRNLPFVYSGTIATLPGDEPIPIERKNRQIIECEGYLVETQTLGGASGSPAFVRGTVCHTVKQDKTEDRFIVYSPTRAFLLGVYQGAWEGPPEEQFKRARETNAQRVPMGVGIVVPASRLMELLNYEDVVKARQERKEARIRQGAAVTDPAFEVTGSNRNPNCPERA